MSNVITYDAIAKEVAKAKRVLPLIQASAARIADGDGEMIRFATLGSIAIRRQEMTREALQTLYPGEESTGRTVAFLAQSLSNAPVEMVAEMLEATRNRAIGTKVAWWSRLYDLATVAKKSKYAATPSIDAIVKAPVVKAPSAKPAKPTKIDAIKAAQESGAALAAHVTERGDIAKTVEAFRVALLAAYDKANAPIAKPRTKR